VVDVVDKATRSRMMAGIRGKDTRPERLVRSFLHGHGFRYRLHVKTLPGRPDIVLPKYRTVIFVHGCFWHQHKGCKDATVPKSNIRFWKDKLAGNVERDMRNVTALRRAGWRCLTIWECQTVQEKLLAAIARKIQMPLLGPGGSS
jgi:DNA mismatch endonuclease, patch repair protein